MRLVRERIDIGVGSGLFEDASVGRDKYNVLNIYIRTWDYIISHVGVRILKRNFT